MGGGQLAPQLTVAQGGRPDEFVLLGAGLVVRVSLLALHEEGAWHCRRAPHTCEGGRWERLGGTRGRHPSMSSGLVLRSEATVLSRTFMSLWNL